ncbi:hypothetical protein BGZ68_004417 [Mortierella alpina]|nr:hypothetical protein BGZ68_004417 [Mortierella alpina]
MLHPRWIVWCLIGFTVAIAVVAAQDSGEETDDPPTPSDPVLTGTFPPLDLPTSTTTETTAPTATSTQPGSIPPTIPYIPPPSNSNINATDPIFPPGSDSCQKCRYFYPKLKECNQIANRTLSLLPRPDSDGHYDLSLATTTPSPAEFTTLLPFLNCICPNQGLAASKICLMCFHISGQPNFLNHLVLQNVTNSLSPFQLACLESGDGTYVPPAARKGPSASGSRRDRDSEALHRIKILTVTALTTVILRIAPFASM